MMLTLPRDVANIINRIQEAGFEAFAVGGCIRDSILGREPNDWDITTSALPQQVKALFSHTIDTGIQHGTVTVMLNHVGYEVTTYRIDGEYEDSRHPKEVTFTPNLVEDLKRRDFTINAMAYNDRDGLVDVFEGQQDLKRGIIRAVGNPVERFTEDALRMMRAVRFAAQLGYEIEPETAKAIRKLAPNLQKISAERIAVELNKLLTSPHPEHMRLLYKTGITAVILPEFDICMETGQNNPHHCFSVGEHIIHTLQEIPPDKVLRLTMLFHDIAKPQCLTTDEEGVDHFHGHPAASREVAIEKLRGLKYDNDTLHKVRDLVLWHDREILPQPKYIRRALHEMGEEKFLLLLEVKRADTLAQSDYKREEKLKALKDIRAAYEVVKQNEQCFQMKDLQIDGKDLIAAGVKPGPAMGEILNTLLAQVIEDPTLNDRQLLLQKLDEMIKNQEIK